MGADLHFASPIIALILYLALWRKQTLLPCQSCQQPIPHTAQYCEHCGAANEQYGQPLPRPQDERPVEGGHRHRGGVPS